MKSGKKKEFKTFILGIILVVVGCLCGLLAYYLFPKNVNNISESEVYGYVPEVVVDDVEEVIEEIEEVEEVEEVPVEVTLTQEKIDSMSEYLKQYNFINIIQSMRSGLSGEASVTTTIYTIKADATSKIAEYSISQSAFGENFFERFTRDFSKKTEEVEADTYQEYFDKGSLAKYREETDDWIEVTGSANTIVLDLNNLENAEQIWGSFLDNYTYETDTVGTKLGNIETYEITSKASEDAIEGLESDYLGDQIVTFEIECMEDGSYKPLSYKVYIEYIIGEETYYCETDLRLALAANLEQTMPELTKLEE